MNFSFDSTLWIFISGGDEDRFIDDIRFGISVLKSKGVPKDKIKVFLDGIPKLRDKRSGTPIIEKYEPLSKLEDVLAIESSETAVLMTTGHGGEYGLVHQETQYLSPYKVISAVRSIQNLKRAALVLGQCYAGVFNFVDASGDKPLCIIGSTGYEVSLSFPSNQNMKPTLKPIDQNLKDICKLNDWTANLFLYNFFQWIHSPKDIDGDGQLTLMDAFKFASIEINKFLNSLKRQISLEIPTHIDRYHEIIRSIPMLIPADGKQELTDALFTFMNVQSESLRQQIENQLQNLYIQHEPFILNAKLAQQITF
jgi:hypothetical protein